MYLSLDGPSVYSQISVGASATEVKVGASRYSERQIVTIQPLTGDIWLGYSNSLSSSNGTKIFKNQLVSIEASNKSEIWILAVTGTVTVAIGELS